MKAISSPSAAQPAVPTPHWFRITYSNAHTDEESALFKDRDAVAYSELTAKLPGLGYEFGTTLYLYPHDERDLAEFPVFRSSDLLVLTTRPPLHDETGIAPQRKIIQAAKTELEAALWVELGKYFDYCTRKFVRLTEFGAGLLRVPDRKMWEHIEVKAFRSKDRDKEFGGAEIQRHFIGGPIKHDPDRHSTIAYFLRANQVPGLNCDFVASFGMDAFGTLIWNRLVRQRFPEWLAKPGFVMAELIFKKRLPDNPLTPEFVDDGSYVEVRLLT